MGQRVLANGQKRWRSKICDEFCGPCFRHLSVDDERARLPNLQRPARAKAHRSAVKAYTQRLSPKMAQIGAFPPEDFQAVWHRLGGRFPKRTLSKRKTATIEWCIFPAAREKEHARLAGANTIGVAMGERNDRLIAVRQQTKGFVTLVQSQAGEGGREKLLDLGTVLRCPASGAF